MTLIDDDEVEEVRIVVFVEFLAVDYLFKVLIVGKEDFSDTVLARGDGLAINDDPLAGGEGAEGTERLILEAIAVGEEQNVLAREGVAIHHFPDELEHGECLAGAGRFKKQGTVDSLSESPQRAEDRHVLIGPHLFAVHLIEVIGGGKCTTPAIPVDGHAVAFDDVLR